TAADPPPLDRVRTIALKGPAGGLDHLALDAKRGRLFVANTANGSLDIVDLNASIDVDDLSFDPRRKLIFASCGEGAIAVTRQIDADRYESLGTIATVKRARTSIFNPETGELYLAIPRIAERADQEHPEIWVYRARP